MILDRRSEDRCPYRLPVEVRVLGPEGVLHAIGTARLEDVSRHGLRLGEVRIAWGAMPIGRPTDLVLVPLRSGLTFGWMKLRPLRLTCDSNGVQIAGEILAAGRAYDRILDLASGVARPNVKGPKRLRATGSEREESCTSTNG